MPRLTMFRNKHPRITALFISLFLCLVAIALAEGTFRGLQFILHGSNKERQAIIDHRILGWSLNPHQRPYTHTNACGESITIIPADNFYLIRKPLYENQTTILFLGDSFTHAFEVSTGEAYYDVFTKLNKDRYSVYAAGVGGYGNLQEYLLLKQIYNEIKPEIVMWQLCDNDVQNNVYELDKGSLLYNHPFRPYLDPDNGLINYKNPGFWLFEISHVTAELVRYMVIVDRRYHLDIMPTVRRVFEKPSPADSGLEDRGLRVLRWVLTKAMDSYPNTRFIGFNACPVRDEAGARLDIQFEKLFLESGASYFSNFSTRVSNSGPTDCQPVDRHWNRKGNQVAGKMLSDLLANEVLNLRRNSAQ